MADEVLVNDVSDIIKFKGDFKDFMDSLTDHMVKLKRALDDKIEDLSSIKREIQQERAQLAWEIEQARVAYEESHDCGTWETRYYSDGSCDYHFEPDWDYIHECQREYEHLAGPVYHQNRDCEELAHAHLLDAIRHANLASQAIDRNLDIIRRFVESGDDYLEQIVAYIQSYTESSLQK